MDEQNRALLERAKQDKVKFVNLQFTDILGAIKSVTIPIKRLSDALENGVWFDGSSIEGLVRIHESDMLLMPDPSTYAVLPWVPNRNVARIIADVHGMDGKPFEGDPRFILKRVMKNAREQGFIYNTGPEVEFFLLKTENGAIKPVPHDVGGYFDYSARDLATDIRRSIVFALEDLGMTVEMSHHEVAFGQHEIDIRYSDALQSADNVITLKHTIKSIAQAHDLYATFMPKPFFGINGSGMHTHQSLFSVDGKNVFYDENDKYKISKIAYSFIAGQLEHVRAMCLLLAPTVNSYKRLVSGYEAPVYICWAQVNRSALIRVPRFTKEHAARCELRCPDPSCNPYIAFAIMLSAGLDGVEKGLEPPEPVEEDVYRFDDTKLRQFYINSLPGSLGEAIEEARKSNLVKSTLGKHALECLIMAKKQEWDEYRKQVTEWEIKKFLETL